MREFGVGVHLADTRDRRVRSELGKDRASFKCAQILRGESTGKQQQDGAKSKWFHEFVPFMQGRFCRTDVSCLPAIPACQQDQRPHDNGGYHREPQKHKYPRSNTVVIDDVMRDQCRDYQIDQPQTKK